MAKESTPNTIYLKEYTPSNYLVKDVNLSFYLGEESTRVVTELNMYLNEQAASQGNLVLHGESLKLVSVRLNDQLLDASQYQLDDETLSIGQLPETFTLTTEVLIEPQNNTSLEGLYKSSGNYCTQCEAEGFRKITYYLDRPDVMATFTTSIYADKDKYPVLLSNGNLTDSGEIDNGQHFVTWHDPFKKPCYLFALVAGDLAYIEDKYSTMSGRDVQLRIYVQHHNIDQCDHAMQSLIKSMQWDEETYAREYDLDVYNIVAVDDFNMGAMENKGLNVFNSKYVLANQETATDSDFINIEGVIGHEYFHNWSGNRVTCRDWFQLTLKEGLTVFRDQQFTADMNAVTPKRIDDVNILRTAQFAEDAGPMAHPIQPDSYLEINNFYTVTVYNKGAEIIRMIHTLLSKDGFRRGMDLYFSRHDGQAVTTEEFLSAMEDANDVDLKQFRRWYKQAGTPTVSVSEEYDSNTQKYVLKLTQSTPATPGQELKQAFDIPVVMGLMGEDGQALKSCYQDTCLQQHTLRLNQAEQSFVFTHVEQKPILSLLRGFSAPVKLRFDRPDKELAFCMAHDADEFNRWDVGQQLACRIILSLIENIRAEKALSIPSYFVDACQYTFSNTELDKALIARALSMPSHAYVAEQMDEIDVDAIHQSLLFVHKYLGKNLQDKWLALYNDNSATTFDWSPASMAQRLLKNTALLYLVQSGEASAEVLALQQFETASNMTDQLAAFRIIVHYGKRYHEKVIDLFYQQWKHDQLVMDKWFTIQATSPRLETLARVKDLFHHEDFDLKNPNRVRSLIGAFCAGNPVCFHMSSGEGYALLGEYIEQLNDLNPQIAARLTIPLTRWKRYPAARQNLMKAELQRLVEIPELSRDVYELVSKSLK